MPILPILAGGYRISFQKNLSHMIFNNVPYSPDFIPFRSWDFQWKNFGLFIESTESKMHHKIFIPCLKYQILLQNLKWRPQRKNDLITHSSRGELVFNPTFLLSLTPFKKRETKTKFIMRFTPIELFFCTCGCFGFQKIFQVRERQLVSHCQSSKFVLSFFILWVNFCLVMRNYFLRLLLFVFSLKKSVELCFNRSKIFLLYFYDPYFLRQLVQRIHAKQISLQNFIIFLKKNIRNWRLHNASKTFLNQWESMGFCKLYWIFQKIRWAEFLF